MLGGDFNENLQESEKQGGMVCDPNNLCDFRVCLDVNNLREIDFLGHPFTWSNKWMIGCIEEKLDRSMANSSCFSGFPSTVVEILFGTAPIIFLSYCVLRVSWVRRDVLGVRMIRFFGLRLGCIEEKGCGSYYGVQKS